MTENEIKFFAKQINFFWTENARLPETLKMFENRELYDQIDEYIWIKSPKIRILFNKKFQEKLVIILFYGCLGVLVTVVIYEEYASYFAKAYETIIEWLKGIIK